MVGRFCSFGQMSLRNGHLLMAKSMEARLGKKLDLKLLGFPNLTKLLVATCADLFRLKHPSKDRTHMFPVKLYGETRVHMTADFHLVLIEILPQKDDKFPLSHVKSAFKAKFHYDLDHEAVGYSKLHQFVGSMSKLVRLHHSSSVLPLSWVCHSTTISVLEKQQTRKSVVSSSPSSLLQNSEQQFHLQLGGLHC